MKRTSLLAALTLVTALSAALPAYANDSASRPPMDDAKRQEMLKKIQENTLTRLDSEIRILQTTQTCVRAAATPDVLRTCHEQKRTEMQKLHKSEKAQRDKMRAEHQAQRSKPN